MDQNQDYQKVLDNYAKATLTDVNPTPIPEPVIPPIIPPIDPPSLSPPPTSIPIPSKTNSGFDIFKYAFFLSLIIFLGVVATLGYNLYKQYFSNSPATTPPATSESPTPSVVATPTSTAVCQLNDKSYHINEAFPAADGCNTCTCGSDLTISCTDLDCSSSTIPADWQNYSDSKSGISFKYPKNWKVNSSVADTITIQSTIDPSVDVSLILNQPINPLPTFAPKVTPVATKINSVDAQKVSYLTPESTQVYIYISPKNLIVEYHQSSDSTVQLTIDQILSTFKFTDSTSSIPADWKTYENQTFKFKVDLPSDFTIEKTLNDKYNRVVDYSNSKNKFEVMLRDISTPIKDYFYMDNKHSKIIKINNQDAYLFVLKNGYCDGPSCSEPSITYVINQKGTFYHLIFSGIIDPNLDFVKKTIGSFKFL